MWGEDLLALRRALLDDPRLQVARVTEESAKRTELVKAHLDRQRLQADSIDEKTYLASLQIKVRIERVATDAKFDRIEELFRRTTQFNATSRLFSVSELQQLATSTRASLFSLHVSDRFADHGLVGAAVLEGNEITGLVVSCRVLGMSIEHEFVRHVVGACSAGQVVARIVPTARNIPVRNIYRGNGFVLDDDGVWRWDVPARASAEAAG